MMKYIGLGENISGYEKFQHPWSTIKGKKPVIKFLQNNPSLKIRCYHITPKVNIHIPITIINGHRRRIRGSKGGTFWSNDTQFCSRYYSSLDSSLVIKQNLIKRNQTVPITIDLLTTKISMVTVLVTS